MEDEDAVVDAVGEFLLLGVEPVQPQHFIGLGVVGHQVPLVDVLIVHGQRLFSSAQIKHAAPQIDAGRGHGFHTRAYDAAKHLVARPDARGDGGPGRVDGLIVIQQGGGFNDTVGKVVGVQLQLLQGAEHAVGQHAAQLAAEDLLAAGQQGVVLCHGDEIARVDVPRAGADLERLFFARVDHGDEHMVGIGVLFDGENFSHHHIFDLRTQVLGGLHLGAGHGHRFGKGTLIRVHRDEVFEPFS